MRRFPRWSPGLACALTAGALTAVLGVALLTVTSPAGAAPGPLRSSVAVDQVWDVPARAWLRIRGHGYGHGHGMSQYGAEGAGQRGLGFRRILAFYYPGTELGTARGRIRVLVSADTTDSLLVRSRPGLVVRNLDNGRRRELPNLDARRWRLLPLSGGRTSVSYLTDRWRRWRVLSGAAQLSAGGRPIALFTPAGVRRYRGALRSAEPSPDAASRDTVNVLSLQAYLRGVVPLEMPATWTPAAVRAQAVAARTYAAWERANPRAPHYQICDTTSCQVYGGVAAEHPLATAAIRATARQALIAGSGPAFTQFSASSGGWTAAGSRPYLPAQPDPYDDWPGNPVHDWSIRVGDGAVERAYPGIGNLTRIRALERDGHGQWQGRVTRMRLVGSSGRVTVTGEDFRAALGLRSSWFTFGIRPR